MARPTLNQVRNAGDFATTIHWDFSFVTLPNGLTGASSEDLNLRCESTDMPKSSNSPVEIWVRGHRVKQPGLTVPSGQISMTYYDTVDSKVSLFIRNWRELCYQSNTGIQGTRSDVECQIQLKRRDRADNIIWIYNLYGVFLEDYDTGGQLQGSSADVIRPSMVLSYDAFDDSPAS